jgi:hypothetical protein
MKYTTILFPAMVAAMAAKGNTGKAKSRGGGAASASAVTPASSGAAASSGAPAAGGASTNAGGGEFSFFPLKLVDQV